MADFFKSAIFNCMAPYWNLAWRELKLLLWGLYFGILLLLEKFVFKNWLNRLPSWMQHIYACLLVIFGWVLFAFEDMNAGFAYLLQMIGGAGLPFL